MLCLVVTGCGSAHLPSANASSSRASAPQPASYARVASAPRLSGICPPPELPRSFPTSPASNRNLVLGTLRGSDQTVVRDVTDIDHPTTTATLEVTGLTTRPSFVSPSAISYVNAFRELVRAPLSGSGTLVVAATCGRPSIPAFAWSPDGQSFTYVVDPEDAGNPTNAFQWHLASHGIDRVMASAPTWCYCGNGTEDLSLATGFSPDGQFVSLVEFVGPTDLQVRRLDGSLVGAEIRGDRTYSNPVTMGVWSGPDLFVRDTHGVERWSNGVIKPFLPGVEWLYPRASPSGGQMVYAARGVDGLARISVVDVASGLTRQLSSEPGSSPFFLTPRYVWYKGERLCASGDPCYFNAKTILTDKTYIYDLQTGTETESIIADIADVWPHGA